MDAPKFLTACRQAIFLVIAAALPAFITGWAHPKAPSFSKTPFASDEVTIQNVASWKTHFIWIDARRSDEFRKHHLDGALSLNEDDWSEQLPTLLASWSPGVRLVVYCDGGRCEASREVASRLQKELGLHDVYVLKGKWSEWSTEQK